ncbi:Alcohol dehydrogenase zinc-binding domain protein [Cellulomonas flavigena DSM 20109]|uniref:Alcohol dehydrogenase zinc-binding domain protein n=1 Tax=Cellulomonas flavigena (strain ATCC 482 / DSM 20109 / BCRC 11376 / JCM 18109 / NBRC 3775 / NCIMB 8073 / NRS 134) TaxID=446466 RepID=D5UCJ4_CELFN|nr:zinc-binding dehydrogenase [Cellulomonas flavigena]ADG74308.1 Alcohol dehydrogenase zinc-binding domain protein [Cellulomonas flavigena DSM 20109]
MPTETPTDRSTGTMTVVAFERYGPPDVLRVVRRPVPVPGPSDLVVAVRSVAVARAEMAFRSADPAFARLASGLLRPRHQVLGGTLAGVVTAAGPDAGAWRVGARVVAQVGMTMGGTAEQVRVPAANVVALPDGLTDDAAVAVVEGGLTALPFVRDHARARPGLRVLVNGAGGAVGASAVQLAVHLGATVTGVCGPSHVDLVADLGAAEVVDRLRTPLERLTGTYDVVLDAVGTSSPRATRHLLAPGGAYLTTVPSLGTVVRTATRRLERGRTAAVAFTGLRPVAQQVADMTVLLGMLRAGDLRPVVDRTYPLVEAAAAHAYVEAGRKAGAVLLHP